MNDQNRRRFRPRSHRSGFRNRNNNQGANGHFQANGNGNIGRHNGSSSNPHNLEKTAQKYLQLSKDALASGDLILYENYLQHAEHYNRRLSELNYRPNTQNQNSNNNLVENNSGSTEKIKTLTDTEEKASTTN